MSGQTKTWSDVMIILLAHKMTGYCTINKIHMLQIQITNVVDRHRTGRVGRYLSGVSCHSDSSYLFVMIS